MRPWLAMTLLLAAAPVHAETYVTVVQGLGGQPRYDERFAEQRERVADASRSLTQEARITTLHGDQATRDNLLAHLRKLAETMDEDDRALVYLIGHGSYDGEAYKFNIPGPDITGAELQEAMAALPGNRHFLLNTSSTSGATLEILEQEDLIVITATRSGNERNAPEFGTFFAQALSSEEADLNKDGHISVQEAFDYANRKVEDFYESSEKLATEHPQLRGEGASRLTLARLGPLPQAGDDPRLADLRERQREIDNAIEDLQLNRNQYDSAEYNRRLQELVLQSATLAEEIEALQARDDSNADSQ